MSDVLLLSMDWSAVCDCAITDHAHLLLKALTKKQLILLHNLERIASV